MIAALVLASVAALLALSLPCLLRRSLAARRPGSPRAEAAGNRNGPKAGTCASAGLAPHPRPARPDDALGPYPESLTAELEPWEEEYLAALADALWPDDEYLDMEHTIDFDGDGDPGSGRHH